MSNNCKLEGEQIRSAHKGWWPFATGAWSCCSFLQTLFLLNEIRVQCPIEKKKVSTQGNFIGRVTNYLSDASADFKINVCQTPQTLQES
jgi:hypothetical protein